jgi:antitoxin MazE
MAATKRHRPKRTSRIEKNTRVSQWGNSLGVRIPQEGVEQLGLRDGETVKLQIEKGIITIRRAKARKKWTEAELLKGVTPNMCGPELLSVPVGREVL